MPKLLVIIGVGIISLMFTSGSYLVLAELPKENYSLTQRQNLPVAQLARLTTVRIFTPNASGSGVIIKQEGRTYTILTNWHVVAVQPQKIIAPDGQKYRLSGVKQLGNNDLAIASFESDTSYQVVTIKRDAIAVGETVFAAGFPMYQKQGQKQELTTTFDQGLQVFRLTQGVVSVLPPKPLPQGYRLGYTNDIEVGMSGGPILNQQGQLIGVNGRVKNRDPDFGVYGFEDGTEPSGVLLQQMINSSWGIPISTYLHFL
jgi:serine protease Do